MVVVGCACGSALLTLRVDRGLFRVVPHNFLLRKTMMNQFWMNEQLPCKYLASLVDLRRCRSGTNNGVRACSPQDSFPPVHNRIRVEAGGTNDANGNTCMGRDGGRGKEYRQRFQVCLKVVRAVKAYTCTVNLCVNAQVEFIISYPINLFLLHVMCRAPASASVHED